MLSFLKNKEIFVFFRKGKHKTKRQTISRTTSVPIDEKSQASLFMFTLHAPNNNKSVTLFPMFIGIGYKK